MATQDQRPLPVGTRLIYYNMQQCREVEAIIKDAGYVILWIIDQEHSKQDGHFISYQDIVQVLPCRPTDDEVVATQ
jgi:hypothetical protein